MKFLSAILLLLLSAVSYGQEVYRIVFLSREPITIDNTPKNTGDSFRSDSQIEWSEDTQVMKVVEKSSRRQYVLAAKALSGRKSGLAGEYVMINKQLSTRSAAVKEASTGGEFFYLGYEQAGTRKTLVPSCGMFMDELPQEVWLCRYSPATGRSTVVTEDFRSFQDDLLITDALVSRLMERMGEDEESRLCLMHMFADERFKDIDYTIEDLKLFLSLKY